MFQDNGNLVRLLQLLDLSNWVVFGNGMDLCVHCGASGVLKAGFDVTVLSDVLISSVNGTPESMLETLNCLKGAGATSQTLQGFLDSLQDSAAVA